MLHVYLILSFVAFLLFSYSKFNDAANSWADRVKNEVSQTVKEESNILQSKEKEG